METTRTGPSKPITQEEVLRRYPWLVAHLICHSLGYFTPRSAANAILFHMQGRPFACEWYSHQCMCRGKGYFDDPTLVEIGRDTLDAAFKFRHTHRGYMAEIRQAKPLVDAVIKHGEPPGMLASWF